MRIVRQLITRMLPLVLACGLVVGGSTTAWSAEVAAPADQSVPLIDGRILALGLGTLAGIAVYNYFTGGWGWGLAGRLTTSGVPSAAAARMGAAWGGRRMFAAATALAGALVGDFIYRSSENAH